MEAISLSINAIENTTATQSVFLRQGHISEAVVWVLNRQPSPAPPPPGTDHAPAGMAAHPDSES
jgi:hypothetical protein